MRDQNLAFTTQRHSGAVENKPLEASEGSSLRKSVIGVRLRRGPSHIDSARPILPRPIQTVGHVRAVGSVFARACVACVCVDRNGREGPARNLTCLTRYHLPYGDLSSAVRLSEAVAKTERLQRKENHCCSRERGLASWRAGAS